MSAENDSVAQSGSAATADAKLDKFPHKVFIGNLAFKTTDAGLREFFKGVGTVEQVNIITRGTRSLGYGFVAFSSLAECESAVEKCHRKELDGREINIEVAKPKAELLAAKKERAANRQYAPRRNFKPRRFKPRQDSEDAVIVSHADADETKDSAADAGESEDKQGGDEASQRRKPRFKKAYVPRGGAPFRGGPRPRKPLTGEPSKTSIFVANLPFSMDDNGLREVFKDYNVKTAKVVVRHHNGRSKGFGFVEVEAEEDQKRLLAVPEFVADGRVLNIKIAINENKEDGKEPAEDQA